MGQVEGWEIPTSTTTASAIACPNCGVETRYLREEGAGGQTVRCRGCGESLPARQGRPVQARVPYEAGTGGRELDARLAHIADSRGSRPVPPRKRRPL